ncbi:unnamed protein product [Cylindrotheca closterium]|uniref:CDP-diacylglycerol--inositol 3-phosphatidyltransferase n=1 Tax=Cylindrotheca closterium TaxID=2856 RepID=A0AAD2FNA8_9STRA|nr:unnamed protein product [Cylindrotheca closterium]
MATPIPLFVPNLLCYLRIILGFSGLYVSHSMPILAVFFWVASAILDAFDGYFARKLDQCSSLGIVLDIVADNILRTVVWLAAAIQEPASYSLAASVFISLEWTTMVCTQLHAVESKSHWKQSRGNDPIFVRSMFANNFFSVYGGFCIFGLFTANIFAYATHYPVFANLIPYFHHLKYAAYCGRCCTALAELWLCKSYVSLLIDRDLKAMSD